MVWGCGHFRPYLIGRHFTIRTDHRPLCGENNISGPVVLQRLHAELEEYRPFTVKYIKGETMPADGLSRLEELDLVKVPQLFSTDQLYHLQTSDKVLKGIVCWKKFQNKPKDAHMKAQAEKWAPHIKIENGIVKTLEGQVWAPSEIRHVIMYHAHDSPQAGHRAWRTTLAKIRDHWFWPGMDEYVCNYCSQCHVCQTVNVPAGARGKEPMGKLDPALDFNQRVHVDLLGPLPLSQGYRYALVAQDAHTKWVELAGLPDKTAEAVAEGLMAAWLDRHGPMVRLVSDQGKEFVNKVNSEVCKRLGIQHQTTSPGHPQSNGLVERTNRAFLEYLRKYPDGSNDWAPHLPTFQFAYNTAPHSSIGTSPYVALYGRRPQVPVAMRIASDEGRYSEETLSQRLRLQAKIQQEVNEREEAAWQAQKAQFDKRAAVKQLSPHDVVYITRPKQGKQFQKFQPPFDGPYSVVELLPHNTVRLKRRDGKLLVIHRDRVKLGSYAEQLFGGQAKMPEPLPKRESDPTMYSAVGNPGWMGEDGSPPAPEAAASPGEAPGPAPLPDPEQGLEPEGQEATSAGSHQGMDDEGLPPDVPAAVETPEPEPEKELPPVTGPSKKKETRAGRLLRLLGSPFRQAPRTRRQAQDAGVKLPSLWEKYGGTK